MAEMKKYVDEDTVRDLPVRAISHLGLVWSEPAVRALVAATAMSGYALVDKFLLNSRLFKEFSRLILGSKLSQNPNALYGITAASIAVALFIVRTISRGRKLPSSLKPDLSGKLAIVTGGTSGIGKATVIQLLSWGAQVIIGCRDLNRGQAMLAELNNSMKLPPNSAMEVIRLDLADSSSVRIFANRILDRDQKVDFLINNAGVWAGTTMQTSKDGHELHLATNHLGHFLLTNLLLDKIMAWNTRVINVASILYGMGDIYQSGFELDEIVSGAKNEVPPRRLYQLSKLCNVWFSRTLQRIFDNNTNTSATSYSVHPGVVGTELTRDYSGVLKFLKTLISPIFLKTPLEGAATILYLCAESSDKLTPGYYAECQYNPITPGAMLENKQKELWDLSEKLVKQGASRKA